MDLTPKALSIKGNTDNVDLVKMFHFWSAKALMARITRQTIDWEEIFANPITCRFYIL